MLENDMMQNLQEMREVAEKHYKLLSAAFKESLTTTFGELTKNQLSLEKQCHIAKNAIVSLDQLLATNKLLSDLIKD